MYAAFPLLTYNNSADYPIRALLVYTDISKANVLNHLRIDPRLLNDSLQQRVDEVIERRVFHTPFESLTEGCSYGESDDHIIRVLLGAVGRIHRLARCRTNGCGVQESVHCRQATLSRRQVLQYRVEPFGRHIC